MPATLRNTQATPKSEFSIQWPPRPCQRPQGSILTPLGSTGYSKLGGGSVGFANVEKYQDKIKTIIYTIFIESESEKIEAT